MRELEAARRAISRVTSSFTAWSSQRCARGAAVAAAGAMLMLGRKYTTTPSNSKASLSTLATAILELERDVLAPPKFADFNGWRRPQLACWRPQTARCGARTHLQSNAPRRCCTF